ncbi:2255_t:CDS:2 [Funneliformis mosseae]|uniref:2255_t:CDS:1 n=1 Tax=Funneliformis mosseae TaxID=27381 RepID=A0A9N9EH56_FUNMO|nr:2255_t:CDS:2 [Funneliformis mosseae]
MKKVAENNDDGLRETSINPPDPERGMNKRSGVVRFLNNNSAKEADQSNGSINIIVMNASGIAKANIIHKNLSGIDRSIFKRSLVAEEYEFPTNIQMKIDKLYHGLACANFLNSIVEQNFLFIEDYKYQLLGMYDLQSMDLELKFEISLLKKAKNSIFSISKHGHLLAYYNGNRCITIYLMENGLKVARKEFDDANNILFISFIENDERLFFNHHSIVCSSGIILASINGVVTSVVPPITINQDQINTLKHDFKTTVHIWKKKKYKSNTKQVLEYIWVNPSDQMIKVDSLKIRNCEFSLDLSWPSEISANPVVENIHWPNEAHILKDACVAMEYLHKRSDKIIGPINLYKDLVAGTENLIKKCIKDNSNLWSLSEVRYDIMANIIRSRNLSLLHQILFVYKDKTRISRYLHVPSQYKWPMEKNISDLKLAIEQSSGENRMDKTIVVMLLEYYSNNAEKDTGWMFTLTKALPLLNNRNFGYKSEICSLNVRPRLLLKQKESTLWDTFKSKNLKRRSKLTEEEVTHVTAVR